MAGLKGAGMYPVQGRGKTNQSKMDGPKKGFNPNPVDPGSMHMGGMKDESDRTPGHVSPEGRR